MTQGESVRNIVRNLISDPNIRSVMTRIPITRTTGSNSGYGQPTEAEGTSETVYCVPSRYVKNRIGLQKLGDLEEGNIRLLIRDDQDMETEDKVTFNGDEYLVRMIEPIAFNQASDVTLIMTKAITLSKVQ